jgi:hypothetical protein
MRDARLCARARNSTESIEASAFTAAAVRADAGIFLVPSPGTPGEG